MSTIRIYPLLSCVRRVEIVLTITNATSPVKKERTTTICKPQHHLCTVQNAVYREIWKVKLVTYYNARNNSWPLAIFWPISAFGRPKSILVSQISCILSMGTAISNLKNIHFQKKTADQFLILISSTDTIKHFRSYVLTQLRVTAMVCVVGALRMWHGTFLKTLFKTFLKFSTV